MLSDVLNTTRAKNRGKGWVVPPSSAVPRLSRTGLAALADRLLTNKKRSKISINTTITVCLEQARSNCYDCAQVAGPMGAVYEACYCLANKTALSAWSQLKGACCAHQVFFTCHLYFWPYENNDGAKIMGGRWKETSFTAVTSPPSPLRGLRVNS